MLQLKNTTPFTSSLLLLPDPDGIDTLFTVIKGTFTLSPGVAVAEEQVPVALEETYYGDPSATSIRQPSDVSLTKPGTDVLLVGHAYPAGGRPATQVDVSLQVGQVRRVLRVFGDRVWRAGSVGAEMSEPRAFSRMPLVWERAFGGSDGQQVHPENPVGRGFRSRESERPIEGVVLPNLEDPSALLTDWRNQPTPACFAPVAPHWEPRRSFAGTYDERWERARAPFLPVDFDARFLHLAPPGQATARPLEGNEAVEVRGASLSGTLRFHLPGVHVQATYVINGGREGRRAPLDTVLIEPDANRVVLVWRAALVCDKHALRVTAVHAELSRAA
jgi:Uncharacterized protein conserved in bacteria